MKRYIWRTSIVSRLVVFLCIGGVGSAIAADLIITDDDPLSAVVVLVLTALFCWRVCLYPKLILAQDELLIINPLSTKRLRLSQVKDVETGWAGISVTLHDGRTVTAWAVQKANVMSAFRLKTRSDRVAAQIQEAADGRP